MTASPRSAEAPLARRLRQLREDTHLTQAQMAALFSTECKVGAASISSWENIRTPASPPQSRLEPYARLAATSHRLGDRPKLPPQAELSEAYNSSRTVTLCNGIHSRGVLGAVRALTDVRVRDANESYLAERFGAGEYAILMRVPVFRGEALSPDLRNPESRLYEWPPVVAECSNG